MLNVLLTGIGGQGTVLAAKVLAQAAMNKGWQVRTAETIGMAQRGGSVVSHVRMGNECLDDQCELVHEPLLAQKSADLIIAFEPAEAARVLPYLALDGLLVTATSAVEPVTASLSGISYKPQEVLEYLEKSVPHFIAIDDLSLCEKVGSRKVLNTVLLASAVKTGCLDISVDELKQALRDLVKPRFIELNLAAVDAVLS